MRDIRQYLGMVKQVELHGARAKSPTRSKHRADMQLTQKDIPILSIEVKFNLADEGEDLMNQEAQLFKHVPLF